MTEIRRLSAENIEEIKKLFRDIFTKEPWNDDWSDDAQLHAYITDLTGNQNSLTLGLYVDGTLTGLSMGSVMHWYMGTEYYIYELCIKTEEQGKGLGTEFLKKIEAYISERGMTHIYLQTERNVPAYGFYIKNGFAELEGHASLAKFLK